MVRFSHTVFALPFAALASVFALVVPFSQVDLTATMMVKRLLGVLLCMVAARSAAMAFNRLVDARIDRENPRTATRHLPSGELAAWQVWGFFAASVTAFLLACLLFLPNWLPAALAVPVLAWICGYSFAKRFTSSAHVWLGIALALSPVSAWIAIRGEEVMVTPLDILPALGLALAIAAWVSGFDIIYACQDAQFDREFGLHSIPARVGISRALRIAGLFHALMLGILALLPVFFPQLALGWAYGVGLAAVAALIVRQHWIVSPDDLGRLNIAFFNINAIISFGFSLIAALDACDIV